MRWSAISIGDNRLLVVDLEGAGVGDPTALYGGPPKARVQDLAEVRCEDRGVDGAGVVERCS
jgi:hypothetical protein